MPEDNKEEAIADFIIFQSTVKERPNTYSLGCYAKRVTFYSQQNRALNLVWALYKKDKINKASNIAIVGGGLAGMSAAIAAESIGCSVTIFEKEDEFLPIQQGNTTRYIHPNIYEWPYVGSEKEKTELPFLNWSAGYTNEVIKQIEREWLLLSSNITTKIGTQINSIIPVNDKPMLFCNQGGQSWTFDCVILAVGFGEERPIENVAMRLYWTTDGLHQRLGSTVRQFLVSGCGDGGLIDILRLTIRNFEHKSFTDKFLEGDFSHTYKILLEIDEKAPKNDPFLASIYLSDEYENVAIPDTLEKYINANLRNNTVVTLNGRTPKFLTLDSSIINRFAVFLVMRTKKISYISGSISVVKGDKYKVTFKSDLNSEVKEYDEVVVRHGPTPVIGGLTGQDKAHYDSDKKDKTAKPLWPDNFYTLAPTMVSTTTTTTTHAPANGLNLAVANFEELRQLFIGHRNFKSCFVGGSDLVPEYRVYLNSKTLPKFFSNYPDFKGVKIEYHLQETFSFSMINKEIESNNKFMATDNLKPGTTIINKSLNNGVKGTLACFVFTRDGFPALLSTSHVLAPKGERNGEVAAINFDGKKEKMVADLFDAVRLFSRKNSKSNYEEVNLIDAAVATVRTGIKFSNSLPLPKGGPILIKKHGNPEIEETVYKYSNENGLTIGKVVAVHGTVFVQYEKTDRLFKEVIMVEGTDDKPFASAGDSGALVYTEAGVAIGVVFATSKKATIICPMASILEALNCTLF
jgi:hypothetical protein